MSAAQNNTPGRVVLVFEIAAPGADALDAAASLAEYFDAELAAYFIEDVNVLRAAALSFTREFGLASGTSRQLERDEVVRSLHAQAKAAEASVARIAQEMQLRWSFASVPGSGWSSVTTTAGGTSVVVIGSRPNICRVAREFAPSSPSLGPERRPVVALFDGSAQATRVMQLAALIASTRSAPLHVLLLAREGHDADVLRMRLAKAIPPDCRIARCHCVADTSPTDVAATVWRLGAGLVVMSLVDAGAGERHVMALRERVDCPLVIVRSAEASTRAAYAAEA